MTRSLVDSSSSSSQVVHVRVFWGSGFGGRGGGRILSKSGLLLLVSPTLPTLALKTETGIQSGENAGGGGWVLFHYFKKKS